MLCGRVKADLLPWRFLAPECFSLAARSTEEPEGDDSADVGDGNSDQVAFQTGLNELADLFAKQSNQPRDKERPTTAAEDRLDDELKDFRGELAARAWAFASEGAVSKRVRGVFQVVDVSMGASSAGDSDSVDS